MDMTKILVLVACLILATVAFTFVGHISAPATTTQTSFDGPDNGSPAAPHVVIQGITNFDGPDNGGPSTQH